MIRVAQCFTGGVGSEVIRRLAGHRDMELVAVLVHTPEKAGKDSGELVGGQPNGVVTTMQLKDVIASRPDVAIWSGLLFDHESIAELLRSGINVYTGYGAFFLEGEPQHDLLEAACREGGSSLAAGGNIPGLISDVLPIFLSGYTGRIRHVRAQQRNHCASYPSAFQLKLGLGIGLPPDDPQASTDEMWVAGIRQSAKMVAAALRIPFSDCVMSKKEYALAPADIQLEPSGLLVKQGTVAAGRWTFSCFSGDLEYLTVSNEQTAALALGPGWRQDFSEPSWRVDIDGDPPISCAMGWPEGVEPTTAVLHLNVARAMNMASRLVDAPVGCVSVLDFPLVAAGDGIVSGD